MHYNISPYIDAFSTMRNEELPYPTLQPHQVHDDKIVVVERTDMTRDDLEGIDALITALPDYAIAVRTADCVPVLLYDPLRQVIAAIHSGWRGTVKRISQKTIRLMTERFGTNPSDLMAVIGPSIGPDSFQVGKEVADEFLAARFPMDDILSDRGEKVEGTMQGGIHIDLWQANKWLLTQLGVKPQNIQVAGICTYEDGRFFSARREGAACGRIINAIKLL